MNRTKSLTAASLALLFLAACSSGGIGDILGGGSGSQTGSYEIRGTVESVDTASRSVYLRNVSGYNSSMLSGGGSGNSVRVYYDDQTPVNYNGQVYRPADLERGDEVSVRVDEQGNSLVAESMTVTRNVSTSTGSSFPTYGSNVRGTVRYIDTSRRTIEVDRGTGSTVIVEYETNTPVYLGSQTYRPADLERGDEIDIRVRDLGNGRLAAQDITVTRNMSDTSNTTNGSIIRGVVRYHDTSRRQIEIDQTSWMNRFQSGGTTGTGGRRIIQYDSNIRVDVNSQLHPVSGLEAGDVIEVQVQNSSSSTLFAQRIYLVQDVRAR